MSEKTHKLLNCKEESVHVLKKTKLIINIYGIA